MKREIQHRIETELRGLVIIRTTRRAVEIGFASYLHDDQGLSLNLRHHQVWIPRRLLEIVRQNPNGSYDIKVANWFWQRAIKRLGII